MVLVSPPNGACCPADRDGVATRGDKSRRRYRTREGRIADHIDLQLVAREHGRGVAAIDDIDRPVGRNIGHRSAIGLQVPARTGRLLNRIQLAAVDGIGAGGVNCAGRHVANDQRPPASIPAVVMLGPVAPT